MNKIVLLINSLGTGGAEKVFVKIANMYAKNVGEIKVISLIKKIDYQPSSKVNVDFLSSNKKLSPLLLPIYLYRFFKFCLKNRPKLVQSHLFWSNYLNIIVSIFVRHKTQLVHCVSFESKFSSGIVRIFHYFLCLFLLRRASLNIFKSFEMRDEYIRLFSISKEKTKVIYNPVNKPPKNLQKPFSSIDKSIHISVVGRFHSTKRHNDLIDIAKILNSQIIFHCIGTGELFNSFKNKVFKEKLQENFIFYGWSKDPLSIMRTTDIYLSCSEAEGFPNSLIDAMSIGLPVIHTDCRTGPKEILGSVVFGDELYYKREFGITYSVGDVAAVTQAIKDFIDNKLDGHFYSKQSVSRVQELSEIDSYGMYLDLLDFKC